MKYLHSFLVFRDLYLKLEVLFIPHQDQSNAFILCEYIKPGNLDKFCHSTCIYGLYHLHHFYFDGDLLLLQAHRLSHPRLRLHLHLHLRLVDSCTFFRLKVHLLQVSEAIAHLAQSIITDQTMQTAISLEPHSFSASIEEFGLIKAVTFLRAATTFVRTQDCEEHHSFIT